MKSAYEIAMARLEKDSGPSKRLTEEQKAQIAEIDNKYEARLAEQRLAFDAKLGAAASFEELEKLKEEMAQTLASIEEQRQRAKDAVWDKG